MGRRAYGSGCSGEIVGLGTRLLRDVGVAPVYVTMDSWESRAAYEEFREKYAVEYAELDHEGSGLTLAEKHLGTYEF